MKPQHHQRPLKPCTHRGCTTPNRSMTGRCEDHREPIPVVVRDREVSIGGYIFGANAAIRLADRIIDAVESLPPTKHRRKGKGARIASGAPTA
jgi:hypothetical protein